MLLNDEKKTNELAWLKLSIPLLEALANRDIRQASSIAGIELDPFLVSDEVGWLWPLRLEQVSQEQHALDWIAHLAVLNGQVIGHAGFHGSPDESGMVEVAYVVMPDWRGKGMAKMMLQGLLKRANAEATVNSIRASVRPDNAASLAVVRSAGFEQIGEQWDEVDGLELVFELSQSNR